MRVRIPDRPWDDTVGDQRYDTGQVTMRVPINFQLKTPGTIPMNVHIFVSSQKDYPGSLTIVQLNKTYATVIAKAEKDRVSLVREAQRAWIKRRDEGVNCIFRFSHKPSGSGAGFNFWAMSPRDESTLHLVIGS